MNNPTVRRHPKDKVFIPHSHRALARKVPLVDGQEKKPTFWAQPALALGRRFSRVIFTDLPPFWHSREKWAGRWMVKIFPAVDRDR